MEVETVMKTNIEKYIIGNRKLMRMLTVAATLFFAGAVFRITADKETIMRQLRWRKMPMSNTAALLDNMIQLRRLSDSEISAALDLAWRGFSEYESPDYSKEGTEEFRKCLHDEEFLYGIDYYGAFDSGKLIGMIGIRSNSEHICLFFVDGQYHRKGIGTKMFDHLLENYKGSIITVNSSPFGVVFYKTLGFIPTEEEKTINGIRFTPMIYRRKSNESDI